MDLYEQKIRTRWRIAKKIVAYLKECTNNTNTTSKDADISSSIGAVSTKLLFGDNEYISKKNFVLSMMTEFRIPSPTMPFERLLHAYYKACPCDQQGRGERTTILFTLLALLWKRGIERPEHFFFHCLNLTNDSRNIRLMDIYSLLKIGEVSEHRILESQETFTKLVTKHGSRNNSRSNVCITQESLMLILELAPALLLDFRDSIIQHYDCRDRLNLLAVKEEISAGTYIKITNQAIKIKVIRQWKKLLFRTWEAWFSYTCEVRLIRKKQRLLLERKCTRVLEEWTLHTKASAFAKRIEPTFNFIYLHRIWGQWKKHVVITVNVRRLCFKQSKKFKSLLVAAGRLKNTFWRIMMRLQLIEWKRITIYLIRLTHADAWHQSMIMKRAVFWWRRVLYESITRQMRCN